MMKLDRNERGKKKDDMARIVPLVTVSKQTIQKEVKFKFKLNYGATIYVDWISLNNACLLSLSLPNLSNSKQNS